MYLGDTNLVHVDLLLPCLRIRTNAQELTATVIGETQGRPSNEESLVVKVFVTVARVARRVVSKHDRPPLAKLVAGMQIPRPCESSSTTKLRAIIVLTHRGNNAEQHLSARPRRDKSTLGT